MKRDFVDANSGNIHGLEVMHYTLGAAGGTGGVCRKKIVLAVGDKSVHDSMRN